MLRSEEGLEEALGEVPRLVQRLWTSAQLLGKGDAGVPAAARCELCSVLNAAIRDDHPAALAAAAPLVRAINSLCVVRGARKEGEARFPPGGVCFRGGGLPDQHRGFFAAGRKYRVPGFLATSFDQEVPRQLRPSRKRPLV